MIQLPSMNFNYNAAEFIGCTNATYRKNKDEDKEPSLAGQAVKY